MSLWSFSQDLTPKIVLINSDTNLCFNIEQSKYIAGKIQSLKYCDSSLILIQEELVVTDSLLSVRGEIVEGYKLIRLNDKEIIGKLESINAAYKTELKRLNKKMRKDRIRSSLIIGGLFVSNAYTAYLLIKK